MELVLGTSQKGQLEAYTTQDDTFVLRLLTDEGKMIQERVPTKSIYREGARLVSLTDEENRVYNESCIAMYLKHLSSFYVAEDK